MFPRKHLRGTPLPGPARPRPAALSAPALPRGSAVPAGTRPGRPLRPGSAASGPAGGRERRQGSVRTLFPAPSRQAPQGSGPARDIANRRCPRGETLARAFTQRLRQPSLGGSGEEVGEGGRPRPRVGSSPTRGPQPRYPRHAAHTAAPPERRPRSRHPYRACSAAAAILVGPGVIQRERRRRSSLGPARRWRRVGARCGDGQHRGAEDQAGVQGGAEERGGQSRSPPRSAATLPGCAVGVRERGKERAAAGPRGASLPLGPTSPRGGWDRPAASGRGTVVLEEKGPAGNGGEGGGGDLLLREPGERGRPAAGRAESLPVAGRAVRGGELPAGRVGLAPASYPAARPSRPAARAAVALRAGLTRAGSDGGGRGFRRLQHRLRLAPLLHKPGFLTS